MRLLLNDTNDGHILKATRKMLQALGQGAALQKRTRHLRSLTRGSDVSPEPWLQVLKQLVVIKGRREPTEACQVRGSW